jgi:hypothetical protein
MDRAQYDAMGRDMNAMLKHAGRLPPGLLGMLGLVLIAEVSVAARGDGLAHYQALGTRFAAERATRTAPECAVLGLGDSQLKFGFDPAEVERRLGVKAYNLAVPGTPPPLTFTLLRRALRAGARPAAVVVCHMTLAGHPSANIAEFSELLGPLDCLELARRSCDSELFTVLIFNRFLPSLRYRHALRSVVLAGLRGAGRGPDVASDLLRNWSANRGMERRAAGGAYDGRMEPNLERSVYSAPWHVLWVYEHYVQRIGRLAADHDVPVFWLIAPIVPEAQARREALGLDAHHTGNLRAVQARSPNLVILDARRAGYPASAFFDSCHLNARGASRLSAEVALAIGRYLDGQGQGERWVILPPFDASDHPAQIATGSGDKPPAR